MARNGAFWVRDKDTPEWAEKVVTCLEVDMNSISEYDIFLPKASVGTALAVESNKAYSEGTPLFQFYFETFNVLKWALDEGLYSADIRTPPMEDFQEWADKVTFISTVVDEVPDLSIMEGAGGTLPEIESPSEEEQLSHLQLEFDDKSDVEDQEEEPF